MTSVRAGAAVDDDGHEVIHAIWVDGIIRSIEKPEFERKDDPVRNLDVTVVLLHVLEPLQVKRQDGRKPLHAHPFMRFLVRAAGVAFKLVVAAEGLRVAEVPETTGDGGVLET